MSNTSKDGLLCFACGKYMVKVGSNRCLTLIYLYLGEEGGTKYEPAKLWAEENMRYNLERPPTHKSLLLRLSQIINVGLLASQFGI